MDENFPDLKKNFKFHLAKREFNKFDPSNQSFHQTIKLVDCGGKPKKAPHQLTMLPYIKQNWHDVFPAIENMNFVKEKSKNLLFM